MIKIEKNEDEDLYGFTSHLEATSSLLCNEFNHEYKPLQVATSLTSQGALLNLPLR